MRTRYRVVDKHGNPITLGIDIPAFATVGAEVVAVEYQPNNDPEDPSDHELVMTIVVHPR